MIFIHITPKAQATKKIDKLDFMRRNKDGGVGRHTGPPRTTRTDRESNSKGD